MGAIRIAFRLAIVALVVCLAHAAFAQVAPPSDSASGLDVYAPLVAAALTLLANRARAWTPNTGWLHTGAGHALLVAAGAVLGAVAGAIADHGFSRGAIILAVAGAFGALAGAGNPSNQAGLVPKPDKGSATVVVLLWLACAGAVGFASALLMAGCQTPGGQALKTCEMNALPQTEQAVLADVGTILLNPSAVVADLVALAAQLGPAQVGCAVQAWDAYLASKTAAPSAASSRLMAGVSADQVARARALAHAFLTSHPSTSCGPRRVAAAVRALDDPPACVLVRAAAELGGGGSL